MNRYSITRLPLFRAMSPTSPTIRAGAILHALTAGLLTVAILTSCTARADDTEIFVGSNRGASVKPNVLFIMDTSSSMNTKETVELTPYDSSLKYEGDCQSDRIYWSRSNSTSVPACSSARWIAASALNCESISSALASSAGRATAVAAQYRGSTNDWGPLAVGNNSSDVECRRQTIGGETTYHFYSANYLNWFHSEQGSTQMTRLAIVQDIARKLVDSISGINIGLMRFDARASQGGYVDLPIGDIDSNRESFKAKLNSYQAASNTPLSETLYEAALYWRGEEMKYGKDSQPNASTEESHKNNRYISPITEACQKNHIVYLTDGEPVSDTDANGKIAEWIGYKCDGNCLDELAEFLFEQDQNANVPGINNVITHTIGFHTDQQLLRDAASKGGGNYYTADDYSGLQNALTELFAEILSSTSLFTAPAVSVNAFNRLSHLDEVYFALFRPSERAMWQGNVKRYRINPATGLLVDADEKLAINSSTGEFADNARSFWSDSVDGNDIRRGGAAEKIPSSRKTYTYTGDDPPRNVDITASDHQLHEGNEAITSEMLGLNADEYTADYRRRLLQWIRGQDVNENGQASGPRQFMGDPLHSRPVLVTYGEDADDPRLTMFVTTNEGYLHAIDTATGQELFAFMPQELLTNINRLYKNPSVHDGRIYGLDGSLSVQASDGQVHLYFGMRRGGRNYYALDVSNRTQPKLKWVIHGGSDGFEELGQTWSKPIPTRIHFAGDAAPTEVLIFAGGYDPAQDAALVRTADTQGRGIFIVSAEDGSLLWYGGGPNAAGEPDTVFQGMNYSIPSDIRVVDIDGDGLADQLYVGDMGGQLWRFDIHHGNTAAALVSGGIIADLASDGSAADARRFYNAPDLALISDKGKQWLSIAIGSGWRAHPLDTDVQDRFYMVRNPHVFGPARAQSGEPVYTKITESDLYDATDNVIGEGDENQAAEARAALAAKKGWFIKLENVGEKVLSESITLNGQLIFTTYQPRDAAASTVGCTPGEGIGRAYLISILDATPVQDLDESGDEESLTKTDRSTQLLRSGIPPTPTVLFIGTRTLVLIGPEQPIENVDGGQRKRQIFWRSED